jgi:hypothetical protein
MELIMKDFMAKLKNLNYKELAINHAEKMALVLVGILVLTSLACTRWSRYDKIPDEFRAKVATGKTQLNASVWPAEKRTEFESARDLTAAVHLLLSPMDVARYELPIPFVRPLYPQKEKRRDPIWLPVQDLVADRGTVILDFVPEGTTNATDMELAETGDDADLLATPSDAVVPDDMDVIFDDDTAPRANLPSSGVGRSGPGGLGSGGMSSMESEYERQMSLYQEEMDEEYGNEDSGEMDEEDMYEQYMMGAGGNYGGEGSGGMMGPALQDLNARGLRYVAVRGVFPLKEQIEKVKSALNIETSMQAEQMIEFLDFVIERQTAVQGDNPWTGEWETMDIQSALDILTTVTDFDADVVGGSYTDAVFTMPLPRRVAGSWRRVGSHPKIKALSEEEAERQMLINKKAIEKMEKEEKQLPQKPKGFASTQVDIRGIRKSLYSSGSYEQMMNEAYEEYSSEEYEPYNPRLMGMSSRTSMAQAAFSAGFEPPSDRLLLFRYIDFAIEPGNAYRYRVHLVVRNPNFGLPPEELLEPDFAVAETRTTPKSEPTAPVIFPGDVNYFLTRVAPSRTQDTSAEFEVFRWYPDSGTLINGKVKTPVGDFIGGESKTEVLRPEETFMEEEEIPLTTGGFLLDIVELPEVAAGDSDVGASAGKRGTTSADFAIVLDEFGELVSLDQYSRQRDHAVERARLQRQNTPWEYLKELSRPAEPMSALDEMAGEYDEESMYEAYMGGGASSKKGRRGSRGKSRQSNPARRGGSGPKSMIPGSYLE